MGKGYKRDKGNEGNGQRYRVNRMNVKRMDKGYKRNEEDKGNGQGYKRDKGNEGDKRDGRL